MKTCGRQLTAAAAVPGFSMREGVPAHSGLAPPDRRDEGGHIRRIAGRHLEQVGADVDFNQGLHFGEALARCHAIDDLDLAWIEEPIASCSPGYPDVPAGRPGHQAAADIITPSLSPIRRSRCHCLLDTLPLRVRL
jgi:hypothetical protein